MMLVEMTIQISRLSSQQTAWGSQVLPVAIH